MSLVKDPVPFLLDELGVALSLVLWGVGQTDCETSRSSFCESARSAAVHTSNVVRFDAGPALGVVYANFVEKGHLFLKQSRLKTTGVQTRVSGPECLLLSCSLILDSGSPGEVQNGSEVHPVAFCLRPGSPALPQVEARGSSSLSRKNHDPLQLFSGD